MRARLLLVTLVLLLVLPGVAPQDAAEDAAQPGVVVLAHHPHPDDADPLGFPYQNQSAYFFHRYEPYDEDDNGFGYPSFVADGLRFVEGIPDPDRPFVSTLDAYTDAVRARTALSPPAALQISTKVHDDLVTATITVETLLELPQEQLRLMVALVEDPVHFQPPPSLSNGIFDHRFTVRDVEELGRIRLEGGPIEQKWVTKTTGPLDRLWITAWLQAPNQAARLQPLEVVQAATHPVTADGPTRQEQKAVLAEVLSATWCETCLFGDRAVEELAVQGGLAKPLQPQWQYLRMPDAPILVAASGVLAVAILLWRWGR